MIGSLSSFRDRMKKGEIQNRSVTLIERAQTRSDERKLHPAYLIEGTLSCCSCFECVGEYKKNNNCTLLCCLSLAFHFQFTIVILKINNFQCAILPSSPIRCNTPPDKRLLRIPRWSGALPIAGEKSFLEVPHHLKMLQW